MQAITRLTTQFAGITLFWNIFFYVGHLALFIYGWWKQANDPRLAGLNTLRYSVWISRGAGLCLGVDGLLLILPVLRNIIRFIRFLVTTTRIPFDENIWFHRQIAYSMLFWTIVHTTAHYVNMFNVERTQVRKETAWAIMYTQPGGLTGHVMLLIMFFIYTSAHISIRQQCFEAFNFTHHLAILFLLGLYTHSSGCFVRGALPDQSVTCLGYNSWQWTIWGGIAYLVERILREARSRRDTRLVSALMHPSGVVELRFVKPTFKYKAGQWLFLNIPAISKTQWHPFTISSAPDDPYVSCHIRQVGDWTSALAGFLGCTHTHDSENSTLRPYIENSPVDPKLDVPNGLELSHVSSQPFQIRVDGPFGSPSEDVFTKEAVVLIGTGIGVTPFASILKNIWYKQQQRQLGPLRRVIFIWCCRDTTNFEWFQKLLSRLEQAQTDPDFLRIYIYLTQSVDEDMLTNIAINEDTFDSRVTQDPITHLQSRTLFGRPDFQQLFHSLREEIERPGHSYIPGRESTLKTDIGVFYCGPNALGKELKRISEETGTDSVKFDFRTEHF